MPDDIAQRTWVSRVLGVQFGSRAKSSAFAAASQRWQQAWALATSDLAAFKAALLANSEVKADPRLNFVAASATEIPNMLPRSTFDGLLRKGGGTPEATAKVLDSVASYRRELAASVRLGKLESFASGSLKTPLALRQTLTDAMDDIETTLRAAA